MNNPCGCYYGGDCTKTTVCAVDSVRDELEERIAELEEQLDAVLGIKYHTHPSWNCGKDFDDGWNACRKQIDDCIEQAPGGDDA